MSTIQELIEKEVSDFLQPYKENYCDQRFEFDTNSWQYDDNIYQVEVNGYHQNPYKPDEQTPFVLLRLFINHNCGQVHITNIFLPHFMKYNGIGKKIIYKIFVISEKEKYNLFIVDMVNSFYEKMLKRGAIPCVDCNDAVQIVNETKLF